MNIKYPKREILFKAQKMSDEKWVKGYYFKAPHPTSGALDDYISFPSFNRNTVSTINPSTLCQYTELDAFWEDLISGENEQELYEYDIIEIEYKDKKILTEVKYENGMYILISDEFIDGYIPLFDIVQLEEHSYINAKIIGNSIDHPELLENPILYTIVGYSAKDDMFVTLDSTFSEKDALNYADYLSIRVKEDNIIRNGHIISDIEVRKNYSKENEEIIYSSMIKKESLGIDTIEAFNQLINKREIDSSITTDLKDVDTDLEF